MKVKIFWKENCDRCPGCPEAKDLGRELEEENIKVEYIDTETKEGALQAEAYDIISTPNILAIREDIGTPVKQWAGEVPQKEEVKYYAR